MRQVDVDHRLSQISIGLQLFGSGSRRVRAWILKSCRASIGPGTVAKLKFSVSDGVFTIDGIKQREHLVQILQFVTDVIVDGGDIAISTTHFFFIKTSSKFKIMFLISDLNRA